MCHIFKKGGAGVFRFSFRPIMIRPAMKFRVIVLIALAVAGHAVAADQPAIGIEKAVSVAQRSLEDRGLADRIFIESIKFELSSVVKGHRFWLVTWSEKIPASTPKKEEVGMKIYMDGRATRLIE
jgi:hypothetical protein